MNSFLKTCLKIIVTGSLALSGAVSALANDKVTFRLDWVYGSEHAPIFLAVEKGFFADEGIDVELLPGEGSTVTIKLVGNRDADFGYATADQILIAAQRGLPVLTTAVVLQKNATALIFKSSQNIKDLTTDLVGKTIGVQLKSNTSLQWEKVKTDLGLDPSTFTEVPADLAVVPLLEAGRIDAGVAFFHNQGLEARSRGMDIDWVLFDDLGLKIYSTSLLTNAELAAENPDLVHRFTRAFMKGWTYSMDHPDEALAAFLAANPQADVEYSAMKLPEVLLLAKSDDTDANGLGHSDLDTWVALQDTLLEMGVLEAAIDVETVFTNDYLK